MCCECLILDLGRGAGSNIGMALLLLMKTLMRLSALGFSSPLPPFQNLFPQTDCCPERQLLAIKPAHPPLRGSCQTCQQGLPQVDLLTDKGTLVFSLRLFPLLFDHFCFVSRLSFVHSIWRSFLLHPCCCSVQSSRLLACNRCRRLRNRG